MDSNFQVKISADISDLQNRIRSVEGSLKTLGSVAESSSKTISSSFETTSASIQKVGMDMNRARLATFAFGQVIRDAGFFSQSFGLGMLAISNNIPILVDQLVLLSGVSAGFGAVLSVVGSLLAAGLTVFAYWAQGVEREGGTVSGAISKMGNDSESAIGKLVNYLNTPPASDMLARAVAGLEEGVAMISEIMKAGVDLIIAIWDSFGTDISAVLGVFYEVVSNQFNNVLNIVRFASSIIKGDFTGAFEAILNIGKNVLNTLIGLIQSFVRITSTLLGSVVGAIDPLKGEIIKNAGRELFEFGEGLKFASSGAGEASFSFKDFFNGLFKVEKQAGKTKKEIDKLNKGTREPALPKGLYGKDTLNEFQRLLFQPIKGKEVRKFELFPSTLGMHEKEQLKDFVLEMIRIEEQIDDIFTNGIAATIGNAMMAIGEAFATGGNVGQAFGQAILGTLSTTLSQFADMLISASLAGLAFSSAMTNLFDPKNWALALAAGIALKVTAGALGGFARNLSGRGASSGATAAAPATSFGGINSGAVNFPTNTSAMAISNFATQSTLETRVSGNDLVILMDRASKNRGNYF